MRKLTWPDNHHLDAAIGWLELGNWPEANDEIERITPEMRVHPDVLQVRCKVYAVAEKWEIVVAIAGTLSRQMPTSPFGHIHLSHALRKLGRITEASNVLTPLVEKFPKEWRIPFHLACYACLLGDRQKALWWLEQAIDVAGTTDIRLKALDEPDLETLWRDIAEI
jgi:hypothetical protein